MSGETHMKNLPLTGIRVVDSTNSWSGPFTTQLLASFGAQVIKVESIQYVDTWRASGTAFGPQADFWERSPLWNSVNVGKLGITLNLRHPKGIELFKRLVKISDIVAENFTPRVMKNFGLDYPVLREVNPCIIMISLPANGETGPWSDYVGFAASIEQMAGIPQLTGYPDGPPKMSSAGFTDPIAGANGAIAVMMALLYRQMTGIGQYIDLSQVEASTSLIGDAIVDYTMNKRIQPRRGNHHPFVAPHECYRCKGEDQWVDLAVYSDEEWRKFCHIIGNPALADDERFADSVRRWQNRDELDSLVEAWTVQHDHYEIMHVLQKAGIAAGAVLSSVELLNDPHLKERGTFQVLERAVVGTHPYPVPSAPMKLSGVRSGLERPAPTMGQHNEYVLGELLGLSQDEIKTLADEQVIGTKPLGV
jgi:crotonobetainyl-CoA:carnitine CoA-transferase CaiB-like acyl-CoA transferase